ncbi:MAG: phosphatidylserine/phosphatidylglycerophosphate/cardiolipin synthase family protein [Candidatus Dormibacteria bacterium]
MTITTFALGPDSAGTVLMRLVRGARHSIDAAVYEVGPSYRWALIRAAERGVRVRLVLDAHVSDGNASTARGLSAAGGACRVAGVGAESSHGKLLVVDSTVAVGTGNLIWRDAPRDRRLRLPPAGTPLAGTREWWVTAARSRLLHRTAVEAFDAHWAMATAPPPRWAAAQPALQHPVIPAIGTPTPQVGPRVVCARRRGLGLVIGGSAVGATLGTMISTARRRVLVTVPYARPEAMPVRDLLQRMAHARSRGVACALLIGGVPDPREAVQLAALEFPVRRMDPARSTSGHAKGMVADGAVVVSSANWSEAGLGANWEVAMRVEHPAAAAYYAAAWRRDWETGLRIDV